MKRPRFEFPPRLKKTITGAGIGVVVGLVLWLSARGEGTLHLGPLSLSGDWLKPLARWLPGWPILASLGAAIGAGAGIVAEIRGRQRTALMREVAAKMGLDYTPEVEAETTPDWASVLGPSATLAHRFHGRHDDLPIDIVDVTERQHHASPGQPSQQSKRRRTVCLLAAEGLPDFMLVPRTLFQRFLSSLGLGGMSFDPRQLGSIRDREAVGRFLGDWHLKTADGAKALGETSAELEQREQCLRSLFTVRLMEALGGLRGWSIRVKAGRLLVWRGQGFRPALDREPLATAAVQLRNVLVSAHASPESAVVPALPGDSLELRRRQAAGAALGGVLGAFLGFFAGFGVFGSFWFGSESPGRMSGPVPFFLCLLAGLVLGVLGGVLVGSRLGRFLRLPFVAQPAAGKSSGGWIVAGAFLGFILGGVVGLALLGLVHALIVSLPNAPFWLLAPLFFGCPILGVFVGVIVGSRIQAARSRR